MAMRVPFTARALLLTLGFVSCLGISCAPEPDSSESVEILETEDIGGAIDAELSTEEDPRGRRRAQSGGVLPPGFPAEVPIPAGATVAEHSAGEPGQSYLVLATPISAENLMASWQSLLEAEGWSVHRTSESTLQAERTDLMIRGTTSAQDPGSLLRIVY